MTELCNVYNTLTFLEFTFHLRAIVNSISLPPRIVQSIGLKFLLLLKICYYFIFQSKLPVSCEN
jgi:hypothetical protein